MKSARQRIGADAEQRALEFLEARGLTLLERNVASKLGEIDLLMRDGPDWVFIEVRARNRTDFGGAAGSVGPAKQQRLRRQAQLILKRRFGDAQWPACRFDVCAIDAGAIDWIRDAF